MSKEAIALKAKQVEDIAEKVKKAKSVVIVDYRGLTVAQDTEMRVNMRNAGVDYKVLKNRLVLRALNNCGFEGFEKVLEGPTAVAFGYEDAVAPAKIVAETITKTNNKIAIKGGIIEGKQASAEDVNFPRYRQNPFSSVSCSACSQIPCAVWLWRSAKSPKNSRRNGLFPNAGDCHARKLARNDKRIKRNSESVYMFPVSLRGRSPRQSHSREKHTHKLPYIASNVKQN